VDVTWTYSGNPGASDRDLVRFLIGDTDTNDQQLTNAEIDYLITEQGSANRAALEAARGLLAKYSRTCDQKTSKVDTKYSQRRAGYAAMVSRLQLRLGPVPYAGGISEGDKDIDEGDSDRVDPAFKVGMMEHDGTNTETQDDV